MCLPVTTSLQVEQNLDPFRRFCTTQSRDRLIDWLTDAPESSVAVDRIIHVVCSMQVSPNNKDSRAGVRSLRDEDDDDDDDDDDDKQNNSNSDTDD